MSRLDREDDVNKSESLLENNSNSQLLEIPIGKTPVYILDSEYHDGHIHWVDLPNGGKVRVVCGGGIEGKGFAPNNCLLCKYAMDLYKQAKDLEAKGNKAKAEALRKIAGKLKAKYSVEFLAAKGDMVRELVNGKKVFTPDFEDAAVGILSMTKKNFEDFIHLRNSEEFPFIKTGKDLTNRVITLDKSKKGDDIYPTIDFKPAKSPSEAPQVEFNKDDFDFESHFKIDEDLIQKTFKALTTDGSEEEQDLEFEEDDADAKVEFEDDDETEDEVEEEKVVVTKKPAKAAKPVVKEKVAKKAKVEEVVEDEDDDDVDYFKDDEDEEEQGDVFSDDDDDFEDDPLPDLDDEENEKPAKKTVGKKVKK